MNARHWHTVVDREFPDAAITDRSALTGGKVDGYLYLSREGRPGELALPGLDNPTIGHCDDVEDCDYGGADRTPRHRLGKRRCDRAAQW